MNYCCSVCVGVYVIVDLVCSSWGSVMLPAENFPNEESWSVSSVCDAKDKETTVINSTNIFYLADENKMLVMMKRSMFPFMTETEHNSSRDAATS